MRLVDVRMLAFHYNKTERQVRYAIKKGYIIPLDFYSGGLIFDLDKVPVKWPTKEYRGRS